MEKFDWFIEMIESGETVNMQPMDYGDFLKYVTHVGKAPAFEKHMVSQEIMMDDDELCIQVKFQ